MRPVAYSIATRVFSRIHPRIWCRIPSNILEERTIYLTFDDGPGPGTANIIDHLNSRDVKASFFFNGETCTDFIDSADIAAVAREVVAAAVAAGHGVGLHGFTHVNAWREPAAVVVEDQERGLDVLQTILQAESASTIRWARPPYGRLTPSLVHWYAHKKLHIAFWDVNPIDYKAAKPASEVADVVRRMVRRGSIVLLHENGPIWSSTPGALNRLVDKLTSDGWSLKALPDLEIPS